MDIGAVTRNFSELSIDEVAALLADNGFKWAELALLHTDANYWRFNGRSDLSDLTNDRMRKIIKSFTGKGVDVPAMAVYTNLLEPDNDERKENLKYFERHMQYAADNGIASLSTECGFVSDDRGLVPKNYEQRFKRLVDSFKWLCEKAERYNVNIALEPTVIDIVTSAKRCRDFIKQVDSSKAAILLDPANLIPNSDEEDIFKYLKDDIVYFHGKDRKVNDIGGRILGDGEINWPLFLSLYHKYTDGMPFILEYVNKDNLCDIRDRLFAYDKLAVEYY